MNVICEVAKKKNTRLFHRGIAVIGLKHRYIVRANPNSNI